MAEHQLTKYQGQCWNSSNNKYALPLCPDLITQDNLEGPFFFSSGTPQEVTQSGISDYVRGKEATYFCSTKGKGLCLYDAKLSGQELVDATDWWIIDCGLETFKFRFTASSPNPSNFTITYADSSKKYWIDGVEYSSGQTASLTPDSGSVEHEIKVENAEITVVKFRQICIQGAISDMYSWNITDHIDLLNSPELVGDIECMPWTDLKGIQVSSCNISGNIENNRMPNITSFQAGGTDISGDVTKTGWVITDLLALYFTNCSGDIYEAGWAVSGSAWVQSSKISACSQPLTGWTSTSVMFDHCPLLTSDVDNIAEGIDTQGETNGTLTLQNTSPPSNEGETHINNLISKSWTVTYDDNSKVISSDDGSALIDSNGNTLITS